MRKDIRPSMGKRIENILVRTAMTSIALSFPLSQIGYDTPPPQGAVDVIPASAVPETRCAVDTWLPPKLPPSDIATGIHLQRRRFRADVVLLTRAPPEMGGKVWAQYCNSTTEKCIIVPSKVGVTSRQGTPVPLSEFLAKKRKVTCKRDKGTRQPWQRRRRERDDAPSRINRSPKITRRTGLEGQRTRF